MRKLATWRAFQAQERRILASQDLCGAEMTLIGGVEDSQGHGQWTLRCAAQIPPSKRSISPVATAACGLPSAVSCPENRP